jgi:hypothetical protein
MSAFLDWLEIYRSYTADELTAEIASLRKQSASTYTGQTAGNKSYTKDPALVAAKLRAATRVQSERGSGGADAFVGVADFSGE